MRLIDSHVNLHHEAFADDREEVIARARAAGVGLMVTICDKIANFPAVIALAAAHPHIYASIGAHPHYAKDHLDLTAEHLIALGDNSKVAGVGETGLDLHYGFSPLDQQIAVFRAHAAAARALDLPLIIHTRAADAEMAQLLDEEHAKGPLRLLLHCYTSGIDLAKKAVALGAYVSFSGIITFKNADDVRAVAAEMPLDRIIVETDCPYLAPVPHRGRRCEPAHVADVQAFLCAWRGLEPEAGAARLEDNFFRLFHTIPRTALLGAAA
jgi:TatD DNase family protein